MSNQPREPAGTSIQMDHFGPSINSNASAQAATPPIYSIGTASNPGRPNLSITTLQPNSRRASLSSPLSPRSFTSAGGVEYSYRDQDLDEYTAGSSAASPLLGGHGFSHSASTRRLSSASFKTGPASPGGGNGGGGPGKSTAVPTGATKRWILLVVGSIIILGFMGSIWHGPSTADELAVELEGDAFGQLPAERIPPSPSTLKEPPSPQQDIAESQLEPEVEQAAVESTQEADEQQGTEGGDEAQSTSAGDSEETSGETVKLTASQAAEHSSAPSSSPASAPVLNIRPHPRLPPSDPVVASQMRYLSYENHSGFHNQRKSLINALLIAKVLNRTLLLPPARLGYAAPWEPNLEHVIPYSERCKAGKPLPSDEPCGTLADRWTYVGWSYLLDDNLFRDRAIVDRWNGSMEWMYEPVSRGGLGVASEDVYRLEDKDRRSYQLYDDRATKTSLQMFTSRIDLEDLDGGEIRDKRLLHFGSLFSGGRLKLTRQENVDEWIKISESIVFEIDKVDDISDEIRDALGNYVAVHLRVGDGAFKSNANANMQGVFRKLCKNFFNLKQTRITALLEESAVRVAASTKHARHKRARALAARSSSWSTLDDYDDFDEGESVEPTKAVRGSSALLKRAPADRSKPLSPGLRCRAPLHTDPELQALNMPLYIATDSRDPLGDRNIAPFFHHFPCAFLLDDFAKSSPVNDKPVTALVEMVSDRWKSDWDGQGLARYLYPFLEAEIAAKSLSVVGTPQSTFSGYTAGTLHEAYRKLGKTADVVHSI